MKKLANVKLYKESIERVYLLTEFWQKTLKLSSPTLYQRNLKHKEIKQFSQDDTVS